MESIFILFGICFLPKEVAMCRAVFFLSVAALILAPCCSKSSIIFVLSSVKRNIMNKI